MGQQSSRIGRKISHVYCIVRTQDSYVSLKRPGYVEDRPEKSRFSLATNLGWRSTKAIITIIRQFAEVAKWRGEFPPPATDIGVKNCFSIY